MASTTIAEISGIMTLPQRYQHNIKTICLIPTDSDDVLPIAQITPLKITPGIPMHVGASPGSILTDLRFPSDDPFVIELAPSIPQDHIPRRGLFELTDPSDRNARVYGRMYHVEKPVYVAQYRLQYLAPNSSAWITLGTATGTRSVYYSPLIAPMTFAHVGFDLGVVEYLQLDTIHFRMFIGTLWSLFVADVLNSKDGFQKVLCKWMEKRP
ncbi:hypothetical protein BCR33DRAFT_781734 [Rhizoclosmatium globosum]|uniref:Uncharacterized protein n=1 Tax=Rhizoclosmatium globosum TaxID=329046 RepID=A0A1Y2CQZ6_9FUNG|nr:hypothetical protein BCR33DRAFT_781734 [Rhizoclosmatium globosum]|eukprot:ORY49469.1 hypothetical protein BCR33DRAFT_781734 [Rhizoclosmatium globosum]